MPAEKTSERTHDRNIERDVERDEDTKSATRRTTAPGATSTVHRSWEESQATIEAETEEYRTRKDREQREQAAAAQPENPAPQAYIDAGVDDEHKEPVTEDKKPRSSR